MVAGIREDVAAGQLAGQREQGRVVGHVARREHKPGLLAVEVCQFALQLLGDGGVARDVSGASRTNAVLFNSLDRYIDR